MSTTLSKKLSVTIALVLFSSCATIADEVSDDIAKTMRSFSLGHVQFNPTKPGLDTITSYLNLARCSLTSPAILTYKDLPPFQIVSQTFTDLRTIDPKTIEFEKFDEDVAVVTLNLRAELRSDADAYRENLRQRERGLVQKIQTDGDSSDVVFDFEAEAKAKAIVSADILAASIGKNAIKTSGNYSVAGSDTVSIDLPSAGRTQLYVTPEKTKAFSELIAKLSNGPCKAS